MCKKSFLTKHPEQRDSRDVAAQTLKISFKKLKRTSCDPVCHPSAAACTVREVVKCITSDVSKAFFAVLRQWTVWTVCSASVGGEGTRNLERLSLGDYSEGTWQRCLQVSCVQEIISPVCRGDEIRGEGGGGKVFFEFLMHRWLNRGINTRGTFLLSQHQASASSSN